MVGDVYAGLGDDADGAKDLVLRKSREERGEEGDGVVFYCGGREAVGEDDDHVARAWAEESGEGRSQGAAKVGAAEVRGAVRGGARKGEDWGGERWKFGAKARSELFCVEHGVDGVTGLGVGELEIEDL